MRYVPTKAKVEDAADFDSMTLTKGDTGWDLTDEMNLIVTHDFAFLDKRIVLPKYIKLESLKPGEHRYIRKRSRQVIRLRKVNSIKHPHEYYYSELQLYHPFENESDLYPDDLDMCKKLYDEKSPHNDYSKLKNVKSILMKHMESVEKGTERAQDIMNSEVEEMMDPEFAQDRYDCELEGIEEHSDFLF